MTATAPVNEAALRSASRWRLHLVKHRSALMQRVHSALMCFGHGCTVSDLFGRRGRALLARLDFPDPWRADVLVAVATIDELDRQIGAIERELRALCADHRYVSLLQTVPGIASVLGYTIAAEIVDITRFATPKKLAGFTGLCPNVRQSGQMDRRSPLSKYGPKYLRWALLEATSTPSSTRSIKPREAGVRAGFGAEAGSALKSTAALRRGSDRWGARVATWRRYPTRTRNSPLGGDLGPFSMP